MNTQQLEHFRQLLQENKAHLEQIDQDAQHTVKPVTLDQQITGRLTRMDAMQAQEMALASQRRRKQKLIAIEKALVRIQNDDYGYCLDCGEDIAVKRLEYDPAITYCLACAEKLEKHDEVR